MLITNLYICTDQPAEMLRKIIREGINKAKKFKQIMAVTVFIVITNATPTYKALTEPLMVRQKNP